MIPCGRATFVLLFSDLVDISKMADFVSWALSNSLAGIPLCFSERSGVGDTLFGLMLTVSTTRCMEVAW